MSPRFALATDDRADVWLAKAARGEPVTAGERNAFVWQAGAAMDALADPARVVKPGGLDVPATVYRGPVREWNGRRVPLVGTVQAPPQWFGKDFGSGDTKRTRDAGGLTWADVIGPNDAERRNLYLATANVMRSLQVSGTVISDVRRPAGRADAGIPPLIIGAIVVGVVGLVSWGLYLYEQSQIVTIREREETARQAAELQAAQAAWLQRVQAHLAHPEQPMPPPSPAETRVTQRPYPAAPPSPAEDGATTFLNRMQEGAMRLLYVAGVGLVAVTAGPPIVANLADRATRGPSGGTRA